MGVWSYDFVEVQTRDGRKLGLMTLIDEFTRSVDGLSLSCRQQTP